MGSAATARKLAVLALVLAALAWVGTGCGAPPQRANQFVGKWRLESPPSGDVVLDLRPDGSGSSRFERYPHEQAIQWSLVSNKLVVAAADGSGASHYQYRFDGPDKLVLISGGGEKRLVRAK